MSNCSQNCWIDWSGSNNYVFHWLAKKTLPKKCVTAPILKPTYDQKPETFLGGPKNYIFLWHFLLTQKSNIYFWKAVWLRPGCNVFLFSLPHNASMNFELSVLCMLAQPFKPNLATVWVPDCLLQVKPNVNYHKIQTWFHIDQMIWFHASPTLPSMSLSFWRLKERTTLFL